MIADVPRVAQRELVYKALFGHNLGSASDSLGSRSSRPQQTALSGRRPAHDASAKILGVFGDTVHSSRPKGWLR